MKRQSPRGVLVALCEREIHRKGAKNAKFLFFLRVLRVLAVQIAASTVTNTQGGHYQ